MLRRLPTLLPILLLAVSLSSPAQNRPQTAPPPGWVPPQALEQLGQRATFHTNFTLDRAMLRFANNFIDNGDAQTRSAVDKLDAITVHSYHFSAPGLYDPALLNRIRAEFGATGWDHMATGHAKGDPFSSAQTDLWISFSHMQVTGMTVLVAGAKDVDVISLTGNLSPLDLLHLRGHFGIPKFDADGLDTSNMPPPAPDAGRPAP